MKGLAKPPSINDLQKAYERVTGLDGSTSVLTSDEIIQFAMWLRFDPRLGEILIRYLYDHFKKLNIFELSEKNKHSIWPQILPVLLSQASLLIEKIDRKVFKHFMLICSQGVLPAQGELFFIGIHHIAGKLMEYEVTHSIEPYTRWGYLCSELMIPIHHNSKKTFLKKSERMQRIKDFLKQNSGVRFQIKTLSDYLDSKVHMRQLERDLIELRVRPMGNTKSRSYFSSE